jgi:hypothetical protein
MRRRELPPNLPAAFSTAHAVSLGVTRSRLRGDDLERPFHGVRSVRRVEPAGRPEQALHRRAVSYATVMTSHEFFSHVAAAVEWGLPLPSAVVDPDGLDVSVLWPHRAPRGSGIRGHAVLPEMASVCAGPSGLAVTAPATTWAMLGAVLGVADLTAVGDAILREPRDDRERPQLATLAELEASAAAGRRLGAAKLRAALLRIRPRVDSRPETRLRLLIVDTGMPEPATGYDVVERGQRLARVDLAYPELRIAMEYEGEHHLTDPRQWAHDIRRYERLEAAGWIVLRVTKDDLFLHPKTLVARIRAARARRD